MNPGFHNTIAIEIGNLELSGELVLPANPVSLILFSHGRGSSRFSPGNNLVAKELQLRNIGTFLFDLPTELEDQTYSARFDTESLTTRLILTTQDIASRQEFSGLPLGYFGAGMGVASALKAAAALPGLIQAVVSRGGRPDLAIPEIQKVKAPTLLIVGERDYDAIRLNEKAYDFLQCPKKLEIVYTATHLFEEPGTLQQAAQLAGFWFKKYLINSNKKLAST